MNLRTKVLTLAAGMLLMVPVASSAASLPSPQTSSLTVGGNVVASCTQLTAATLTFTPYDVFGGASTGATNFTINCTKGSSPVLMLSAGKNGGPYNPWEMKSASTGGVLGYKLGSDATHDYAINTAITGVGNGSQSATVFNIVGTIMQGQDAPVASDYTDSIVVTLSY